MTEGHDLLAELRAEVAAATYHDQIADRWHDRLVAEVERLCGRLVDLEWSGNIAEPGDVGVCPACCSTSDLGHGDHCWIVAEIEPGPS